MILQEIYDKFEYSLFLLSINFGLIWYYLGKLISFNCKLCECKFSDPNAKEMHMKGRKHRLQFKKKVDPKLKVEMKPNNFKNKRNEKWKKQTDKQKDSKRREFRYIILFLLRFVSCWNHVNDKKMREHS